MMTVTSWGPFDNMQQADTDLPQVRWLRKHGLTRDLYFGGAYFREEGCAYAGSLVGADFTVEGGDPNYNRTTIFPRR